MTLVTRLRLAFLLSVASGAAFFYMVVMFDPKEAPEWVLSMVFVSLFAMITGSLSFFGFRIRMRFAKNEYSEAIWKTSLRQALLAGLTAVVVLGLSAGRIASALNLLFLAAFILSMEMAGRRRKHMEITD